MCLNQTKWYLPVNFLWPVCSVSLISISTSSTTSSWQTKDASYFGTRKKCSRFNDHKMCCIVHQHRLACVVVQISVTVKEQLLHTKMKSRHDSMKFLIVWCSAEDNAEDSSQSTDAHWWALCRHPGLQGCCFSPDFCKCRDKKQFHFRQIYILRYWI